MISALSGRCHLIPDALDSAVLQGDQAVVLRADSGADPQITGLLEAVWRDTTPIHYMADEGPREARDAEEVADCLCDLSFAGNQLARQWTRIFITRGRALATFIGGQAL